MVIDTGQRVWRVPYGHLSIIGEPLAPVQLRVLDAGRAAHAHGRPRARPPAAARAGAAAGPGRTRVHRHRRSGPGASRTRRRRRRGRCPPTRSAARLLGSSRHDYRERWCMVEATPKPGEGELWDEHPSSSFHRGGPPGSASAFVQCRRPAPTGNGIRGGQASLSGLDVAFHVRAAQGPHGPVRRRPGRRQAAAPGPGCSKRTEGRNLGRFCGLRRPRTARRVNSSQRDASAITRASRPRPRARPAPCRRRRRCWRPWFRLSRSGLPP